MESRTKRTLFSLLAPVSLSLLARVADAQDRVPLCVATESHRLIAGASLPGDGAERILALPFASPGPGGERFVVAVRDTTGALEPGTDARRMGAFFAAENTTPTSTASHPGTRVLRLGADGRTVGESVLVPDAQPAGGEGWSDAQPALPSGVTLANGVLLLQLVHGDLYATVIPPAGAVPTPLRVLTAPTGGTSPARNALAFFTVVPRDGGALALVQNENGQVFSLAFDAQGRAGSPHEWSQRVGGPLQLMPTGQGPLAALLGHPLEGTGPSGEPARVQEVVGLDPRTFAPAHTPVRTGFAQFPLAMAQRGDRVTLVQWAYRSGFAVAEFGATPRAAEVRVETPTVYPARPALEGEPAGHAAVLGPGNVVYDVGLFEQLPGGGIVARLLWIPSVTGVATRQDVLPLRMRPVTQPALVPAEDGVLVLTAGNDETGGAVDAVHVRCDLVALPPH